MSTPIEDITNVEDLVERASSYGMPSKIVDGNDVLAVKEATGQAVDKARAGDGPTFIECKTYRQLGHSKSDQREYRTKKEEEEWQAKDPIERFKKKLLQENIASQAQLEKIEQGVGKEIEDAVKFAQDSLTLTADKLYEDLYH